MRVVAQIGIITLLLATPAIAQEDGSSGAAAAAQAQAIGANKPLGGTYSEGALKASAQTDRLYDTLETTPSDQLNKIIIDPDACPLEDCDGLPNWVIGKTAELAMEAQVRERELRAREAEIQALQDQVAVAVRHLDEAATRSAGDKAEADRAWFVALVALAISGITLLIEVGRFFRERRHGNSISGVAAQ